MAPDRTAIGVSCQNCDLTSGHYTANGDVRCDDCGRFAKRDSRYCGRHGVDKRSTPSGMGCPYCKQEAERDARLAERQARRSDPNMHPTIDAPANAIDHSQSPADFI